MGALVQEVAFGRELVLFPHPFQMDQGGLPRAEGEVLNGGNWEEIVFLIHHFSQTSRSREPRPN